MWADVRLWFGAFSINLLRVHDKLAKTYCCSAGSHLDKKNGCSESSSRPLLVVIDMTRMETSIGAVKHFKRDSSVFVSSRRLSSVFVPWVRFFYSKLWHSVCWEVLFVYRVLLFTHICNADPMTWTMHPVTLREQNKQFDMFVCICVSFLRTRK